MSKLNEQYFEARKKHKESYKKGTSGVAVILLLITISYFVYNNWEYFNPNSTTLTTEELLTDNKFTVEPLLYVDSLFSVELPEGFFYKPVNEKLRLFAISGDSLNSTSFFVKVEHITTSYQSLTEQWQKQLNETNSDHYVFKLMVLDTLNNVRAELSNVNVQKGGNRMSGLIQLTQIGTTLYIVQGTTLEAKRTENEPIITDFINSFEPKQAYNRR